MAIYNECKIVINLNQLVKARPCGVDLDDEHVDNFANDLRNWCEKHYLDFHCDHAEKNLVISEQAAREWRYKNLIKTAKDITSQNPKGFCSHVLTGHTGSDRAETFLLNLARGSDLAGVSSIPEVRALNNKVKLIRPLLNFSRNETAEICHQFKLPIWIDPSNENINLSRNRVRQKVMPVLEDLHPGCSIRMASLAERFSKYRDDQQAMALVLIETLQSSNGLCRASLSKLTLTARATVLAVWLKENHVPRISSDCENPKSGIIKTANNRVTLCIINFFEEWNYFING